MNVIRKVRKIHGRELKIRLPEDFLEKEVEILVLPLNRDSRLPSWIEEEEIEEDVVEAMSEVKLMKEGKLPEKSARELLNEL